MDWWQAVVLGVVQGLTEFLPVSSSAHLRIVAALAGWPDPGAAFTAVSQLGTESAVLIYFRRDIAAIVSAWAGSLRHRERRGDPNARLGWFVLAGTVPIGVLGLAFQDTIETALRDLRLTAAALIGFALVLAVADRLAANTRPLTALTTGHALAYGFAQALALIPGVSRSGGTISAGLLLGYRRAEAARYSFLLAIPAVLASGALELTKIGEDRAPSWGPTLLATVIAFAVGYAAVAWLLRYLATHTFTVFVIYRVAVGLLVLVLVGAGVIAPVDGAAPVPVGPVGDWSLLGAVPVVLVIAGGVALAGLLVSRAPRWWTRRVPLVGGAAVAVAVVVKLVIEQVWQPFPDAVPPLVLVAVAVGAAAVGLALARPAPRLGRRHRAPVGVRRVAHRVGALAAALLVIVAAAAQLNVVYQQYPTVRDLLGWPPAAQVAFPSVAPVTDLITAGPGQALEPRWVPPPDLPAAGAVSPVEIPGGRSGFAARPGWVYLPPAYLSVPRAQLPVLVLVAGQPGQPRDWLDGGRLAQVMDRYAAAHHGLAPVVIMPDTLGTPGANPLCLDSRLGRVETYLSVDVPAWIRSHLQVSPDPARWAIGGYSQGGTCALQLGVRAPRVYPTFLDISGQAEPTLGERRRTIAAAFGGDPAAFARVNPLDILATTRFPDTAAMLVVGRDDGAYRPQQQRVAAVCQRAGMAVRAVELPGGHTWRVWGPGLEQALPWLGQRTGLTGTARRRIAR